MLYSEDEEKAWSVQSSVDPASRHDPFEQRLKEIEAELEQPHTFDRPKYLQAPALTAAYSSSHQRSLSLFRAKFRDGKKIGGGGRGKQRSDGGKYGLGTRSFLGKCLRTSLPIV